MGVISFFRDFKVQGNSLQQRLGLEQQLLTSVVFVIPS